MTRKRSLAARLSRPLLLVPIAALVLGAAPPSPPLADRHVELARLPLDGLLPGRGAEPVSDRRAGLDDPANRYIQRAELNGRPIERA